MPVAVSIAGVDRTGNIRLDSLQIVQVAVNQPDSCSFVLDAASNSEKPEGGQEVIITDGGGRIFAGVLLEVAESEPVPGVLVYQVWCADYTPWLDRRRVSERYENQTAGDIVRDIISRYCPGFTANNVSDGPTVTITFDYLPPSQCLSELANAIGFTWRVDYEKDVHFKAWGIETASFPLADDGSGEHPADLVIAPDRTGLATRVYVRGGDYFASNAYSQTFKVDGTAREWPLAYKPKGLTVEISTDGGATWTPQTVAVDDLLNQVEDSDYTYNFQEKVLKRGPDKATPAADTLIRATYYPLLPVRVQLDDPTAQSRVAAIEGGDGIYEATIVDESLDSKEAARLRGEAYLREYANPVVTGHYTTLRTGLMAGQAQTVRLASRGLDTQVLIGRTVKQYLPGDRWRTSVELATKLLGLEDLLLAIVRAQKAVKIREDEVLDIIQAFRSEVRVNDTLSVTEGDPESRADYARCNRSEVA